MALASDINKKTASKGLNPVAVRIPKSCQHERKKKIEKSARRELPEEQLEVRKARHTRGYQWLKPGQSIVAVLPATGTL
jgi:ribosome recycling factor